MMKFNRSFSWRPQDKRVADFIDEAMAGRTVTHDDLFEVQFNGWNIRGLNKDARNLQTIGFKKYNGLLSYGKINSDEPEHIIYIMSCSPSSRPGAGVN